MTFGSNIHVSLRINCDNSGDPLTLSGQNFNLAYTAKLMTFQADLAVFSAN